MPTRHKETIKPSLPVGLGSHPPSGQLLTPSTSAFPSTPEEGYGVCSSTHTRMDIHRVINNEDKSLHFIEQKQLLNVKPIDDIIPSWVRTGSVQPQSAFQSFYQHFLIQNLHNCQNILLGTCVPNKTKQSLPTPILNRAVVRGVRTSRQNITNSWQAFRSTYSFFLTV